MKVQLTYILTLLITALSAQKITLEQLKERYPSQSAAYTSESEHLHIETKGNTYQIYSDISWELMYLTDQGKVYGDQSIYFSKFTEIEDIKAVSYLPKKNGGYKKSKVTKFKTEDVFNSSYFYHDSKKIKFTYPGTQAGTKIKLSYRERMTDPHFLGQTFFMSFLPTVKNEYKVTYPSNVELKYKLFNTEGIPLRFEKTEKKGKTTLTWTIEDQDAYESVENAPNLKYYAPHVVVYIGNMKLKDQTMTVLPNLDALYNWYNSLVKDVNQTEDSTLKSITTELVAGVSSKDEKARIIFNWVQDNIKYVAFEDGMGGFIPRPAARVCRNRYGDCKDMSSIITEMLEYADVEASLTWIGSRELPYDYTEIPTPVVDNHMIASYRNEKNEVVYLDAVGSYTPYGYPTDFIQGKQALIRKGEGKYEVGRVPEIAMERNAKLDKMQMKLEGGKLVGTGSINAKGYSKLDFVYPLINKTPKERKDKLESMLEKGNNKFKLQSASFEGIADRDKDLGINYEFTLEDYVKTAGDEQFMNLHLDKDFKSSKLDIEKRRGVGVEFDYKLMNKSEVEVVIPEGIAVTYMPENVNFKNDKFGFNISYQKGEGTIKMNKEIYVDVLMLEKDQFKDWNTMVKKLNKAYKDVVILKAKQ